MAVVRTRDGAANSMDWLERSLRSHEHFIGRGSPGQLCLHSSRGCRRGGGGPSGILYFSATHREPGGVIAHESAHIYMAFAPRWLAEGGATFLEWIAVNQGAPPHNFRIGVDSCESARSLSELEQKTPSVIDSGSICHYSMGFGLFYDLYNSLGDAEFRRGFRELYLRLLASPLTSPARGTESPFGSRSLRIRMQWRGTDPLLPANSVCGGGGRSGDCGYSVGRNRPLVLRAVSRRSIAEDTAEAECP